MKIVKQFENSEFLEDLFMFSPTADNSNHKWLWGLGDDGKLYYQCSQFMADQWYELSKSELIAARVSMKHMKRIVKEFGHLLPFL